MHVRTEPLDVSGKRGIRRAFEAMPPYSGQVFRAPADAVAVALKGEPLLAAIEPIDGQLSLVRKHDTGTFD